MGAAVEQGAGMLFGPERDKSGRKVAVHGSEAVYAGMARCAYRDEPSRRVLVRPAMVDVNASRVRIGYSAHLAVPEIALENFVAVASKAIPRMAETSQARRAQARRPGSGCPQAQNKARWPGRLGSTASDYTR